MPTRRPLLTRTLLCVAVLAPLAACWPGYRPGGSGASMNEFTYESTEVAPQSVKLVDWTTNSTIWTVDIPAGKQLCVRFYDDYDPKNATRPALMRWEILPIGREFGELHNAIPAPSKDRRRVDVYARQNGSATPPPEPAAPAPK